MKKKILLIFLALCLITVYGLATTKKEIKFSIFSKINVLDKTLTLGEVALGEKIENEFLIKNISENPFVITNLESDDDVSFHGTTIRDVINLDEFTTIKFQFKPIKKGKYLKKIKVISNSDSGNFNLTFYVNII